MSREVPARFCERRRVRFPPPTHLVACCFSPEQAQRVKRKLAEWLKPRGLTFNEDKTRIVHLAEGFNFLGFNIRRYPNGKLLIKPSRAAVKRVRERLTAEARSLRGSNATAIIARLTPVVRGWSAYYRSVVSKQTFNTLDAHLWRLVWKWAKFRHANKPRKWIRQHYFGRFNKFRMDHWVFGDRDNTDAAGNPGYLVKFAWTDIVRHTPVKQAASPDDPELAGYWAARRRKVKPPLDRHTLFLLNRQDGRCPLCGTHLLTPEQPPQSPHDWERWWLSVTRRAIEYDYLVLHGSPGRPGRPDGKHTRLVHALCQRAHRARQKVRTA